MDLNNISEEFKSQEFDINTTKLLIELLKLSVVNNVRQEAILEQIVLIKLHLKGIVESEVDNSLDNELKELDNYINKEIEKRYYEIVSKISQPIQD